MPRKKLMTEAELLLERERIDKQILEIRERENTELGEMVKKIFGKLLPDSKAGRVAVFKELKVMADAKAVGQKPEQTVFVPSSSQQNANVQVVQSDTLGSEV